MTAELYAGVEGALIGVDWGTSNFRAFRLGEAGEILARREFAGGIQRIQDGRFAEMLVEQVGDWLDDGERRVLLSGMVGSRHGWVETSYVACPAGIGELAGAVVEVPFVGAQVFIIPGVMGADSTGTPEVMRGEETEAMGVMEACGGSGLVCCPGTHSKWIQLGGGSITSFLTCMTGEVFSALKTGTILARFMNAEAAMDVEGFRRGVTRSAEAGGLLHHLFSVRTLALVHELTEEASASYLSGLLIGHEVRDAMPAGAQVRLAGAGALCALYGQAIEACGGSFTIEDEDAAARGLAAIGRRLAWN